MRYIVMTMAVFFWASTAVAQQISKEELLWLTPEWSGERFEDGRPKVQDNLLERMKLVTLEEAWAVLKGENYKYQYDEGWMTINPDIAKQSTSNVSLSGPY